MTCDAYTISISIHEKLYLNPAEPAGGTTSAFLLAVILVLPELGLLEADPGLLELCPLQHRGNVTRAHPSVRYEAISAIR